VHATYRVSTFENLYVPQFLSPAFVVWLVIYVHCLYIAHLQMLFYESAACLHGRRQIFRGKYYASAFTHYQPVDPKVWHFKTEVGIPSGTA
jgi:hypothetical protein